jgi:hypothetical protein
MEAEDSSSSKDSMSVNNLEKPIPCKANYKLNTSKAVAKAKPTKNDKKKGSKEEIDIGFLSAVKKMQLDEDYEMIDLDDDVASKQKGNVKSNSHYQPSMKTGISIAMLM